MQLLKLTDKVISDSCKKIYLLKHSDNYLAELKERYEDICNIIIVSSDYNNYLVEDGLLVIAVDYYREAYEKVVEELGQSRDINIYYFPNKETEYEEYYRDKYSESELKDIIIFRSGPHIDSYIEGMDFADNARALFEYMLKNNYNNKYKLVWFVKESCDYIDRYKAYKNVEFVNLSWSISNCQRERDTYYYYLCNSKYIFFTDAYGIARNCREDQIRIQLWHGCGFKTRLNFQPCKKRYEYMIVTSQLYGDIHSRLFGLDDEQILVTGLPKEDWLYEASNDEFYEVINKDINEYKKIIIWLPTYRQADMVLNQNNGYCIEGGIGLPVLDSLEKLEGINEILKKNNACMVVKLHPFQKKKDINIGEYSNIILVDNSVLVNRDIHINQIIGNADGIISDYSSVAVDYLLLDRPIGFAVDDLDRYKKARGFIFEDIEEWLPGALIENETEMKEFIINVIDNNDRTSKKRNRLKVLMHRYYSGSSCERLLDALGIR